MGVKPANRPCGRPAAWVSSAHLETKLFPQAEHVGRTIWRSGARCHLLGAAGVLALPLLVAWWLVPDPRGEGTHEQLGLPQCRFRTHFGVRCPTCGMTTAWAHMVRLEVKAALRTNAAGALLAVLDAFGAAWLAVCGAMRRWWPAPPKTATLVWLAGVLATLALAEWVVRLVGHVVCSSGNL